MVEKPKKEARHKKKEKIEHKKQIHEVQREKRDVLGKEKILKTGRNLPEKGKRLFVALIILIIWLAIGAGAGWAIGNFLLKNIGALKGAIGGAVIALFLKIFFGKRR